MSPFGEAVVLRPRRFRLRLFCNVVVCLIGLFLKWQEKEKKGDREKKKRGGTVEEVVEVKLDMHCKGCAQKVRKAVKRLEGNNTLSIPLPFFSQSREEDSQFTSTFHRVPAGMEAVSVDPANNRLKAIGKVDPWKLKEFLEAKTKKKVDFISPKDPPKKPKGDEMKKKDEDAKDRDQKNSSDDKKPKPVSNCIRELIRRLESFELTKLPSGVVEVTVDAAKDVVNVRGTMDLKTLPAVLEDRLKRGVEIVPARKDDGGLGGEKKEKGSGSGGEKKKEGRVEEGTKEETTTTVSEANKMEYYGPHGGFEGYGYRMDMVHAPQMFSDENPNACSVM
ncbi:hypothetical protein GW17_00005381 [Ensete ventricosum]|nr:hypothetical protein GW17_00005381 [Ensete ventricosum]RZS02323.1 hypothetical protein BHM03_00032353 [Ensete ventricosum]